MKSAAKNSASALDDAINGLGELFGGGGGRLSSGLTFDEETYAKAKPLFISAVANIRAAGNDLRDAMRAVVNMVVARFGDAAAANMKPYVVRFIQDVRDGAVQLEGQDDAGPAIHGDGDTALEPVAPEVGGGTPRGGDDGPRGADGEQASGARGGRVDDSGNAKGRGRGNRASGNNSAATGGRGRGRGVTAKSRKSKPTPQDLIEESVEDIEQASPVNVPALDFVITDEVALGKGSEGVKFADNLAAIRTLKRLEQENRRASPEEQRVLARYVGWGGLKNAFRVAGAKSDEGVAKGWEARVAEVEALLTPAELRAARNSTTAAHYTSQTVVDAVWQGVERLGFRGGAVLEPSVGTGNFIGLMPENLRANSKFLAVEYDSITARIAQHLYPNQHILHSGFQDVPLPGGKFALAIGNPPFGRNSLYFRYDAAANGRSIHNQFFLQSIKALDDDGLLGMVVTHNLMDALDESNRLEMATFAELMGAIRLPSTAFAENARTEVVTDILFFRKRSGMELDAAVTAAKIMRDGEAKRAAYIKDMPPHLVAQVDRVLVEMSQWVPSSKQVNFAGSGETINVNPYFLNGAGSVVGTMDASGTMNARADLNVRLDDIGTFEQRLGQAVSRLPKRDPGDAVAQRTMAQIEQLATAMRLSIARAEPGAVRKTQDGTLKVVVEMDDVAQDRKTLLSEMTLTEDTPFSEEYTLRSDGKWLREEDLKDKHGNVVKRLKADGTPSRYNEKRIVVHDDTSSIPAKHKWGAKRIAMLSDMLPIRDAFKRQLMLESSGAPTAMIEDNRKRLNEAYDNFVKLHGILHDAATINVAMTMPDGGLPLAVEEVVEGGGVRRADILSRPVAVPPKPADSANDASEAVAIVLAETGGIDIDRVAQLLGTDKAGAEDALSAGDSPRAFFDPETQGWEPADGYLSGLVRRKLLAAKAAGLTKNVEALEKVQPEDWDSTQVTPNMGSVWIPSDVYADFLRHLGFAGSAVSYSPATNTFSVSASGSASPEWRTAHPHALQVAEIVERTLNSRSLKVVYRVAEQNFFDEEATLESQMKATEISNEFLNWAFSDDDRRDRLVSIFNERFNTRVVRQRDGSHLKLPGADPRIAMRYWQRNAIWRGITDPVVLYDHAVGAGKTYVAIARIMERRRMGLSKKPMVVVPNHVIPQWEASVKTLYPAAKILVATEQDFAKLRRRRLFSRIAAGDYDMVIIGHSSFGLIDMDSATEARYLEEELRAANAALKDAEDAEEELGGGGRGRSLGVAAAERLIQKIEARLARARSKKRDRLLTFEEMGIDDLTVDEAHEFKNLAYSSNLQGVSGMGNPTGSNKAMDLHLKIRSLRERPGSSVAFLTGTPISNSVSEMYLLLKNLAPGELADLGMENFDAWRTTFVSATSAYEPTESGSVKEVARLGNEWHNMKSLMDLYYSIADAVTLQDMKDAYARENDGKPFPVPRVRSQVESGDDRELMSIQPGKAQRSILRGIVAGFDSLSSISDRKERSAERFRLMDRARKVSLDARAIDPSIEVPDGEGKIGAVVSRAFSIYEKTAEDRGAQIIFLDRSVPKAKGDDAILKKYDKLVDALAAATDKGNETEIAKITDQLEKYDPNEMAELRNAQNGGWNAYDEIKRQLVAKGVPANEIRFVQEAKNKDEKDKLFADVRSGKVRILIGSTQRMGAGTNVQDRLVALHHVDVTWKPSDIEQREGRIIRQGNKLLMKYGDGFTVDVIAYATEMTIDAKMWALNSAKLKSINRVRKYDGSFMMEFEDADSAQMAEMAALATGNPLMVERVALDGQIKKLEMAQRTFNRRLNGIRSEISGLNRTLQNSPQFIETLQTFSQDLEDALADVAARVSARRVTVNGEVFDNKALAMEAATKSIAEQQAKTESGKGRYVVEINGERVANRERIDALIEDAIGDPDFEADVAGVKATGLNSAIRAILKRGGDGRTYTIDGITINGMPVEIDVEPSKWREKDSVVSVSVLDRNGRAIQTHSHSYESPQLSGPSLRVPLQRALDALNVAYVQGWIGDLKRGIERAKRVLPEMQAQAEMPFKHAQELAEKRERLQQVVAALSASSDVSRINADDAEPAPASNPLRNADGTFARQSPVVASSRGSTLSEPVGPDALLGSLPANLRSAAEKMRERGDRMERGGLVFAADEAELSAAFADATGRTASDAEAVLAGDGAIQGFYDAATGLTFINQSAVTRESFASVLLHEAIHGGQDSEVDAAAARLLARRDDVTTPKSMRVFLGRVQSRLEAAGAETDGREAAAYIVEEAARYGRENGFSALDGAFMQWLSDKLPKLAQFLRDMVARARAWGMRHGLNLNLTVDDLVAVARGNLARMADGAAVATGGTTAQSAERDGARQFRDTERAYGGREAYNAAKAAGKTKLNYHQWVQVRTPNFKQWFGDWESSPESASQVTDPSTGEPMVVYHGTQADFDVVDPSASRRMPGFWTTPGRRVASTYAAGGVVDARIYASGANVMPVFVNARNPRTFHRRDESPGDAWDDYESGDYDAFMERRGNGLYAVATQRPEQIKSAIGNDGTFGDTDPNITFARAAERGVSGLRVSARADGGFDYAGEGFSILTQESPDVTNLGTLADTEADDDLYPVALSVPGSTRSAHFFKANVESDDGLLVARMQFETDEDGTITALHDLVVSPMLRGSGWGNRIVGSIMQSNPEPVRVVNIVPSAEGFWNGQGAGAIDYRGDAILEPALRRAESRARRRAGEGAQTPWGVDGRGERAADSGPQFSRAPSKPAEQGQVLDRTALPPPGGRPPRGGNNQEDPASAGFSVSEPGAFDNFRRAVQDRFIDLRRAVESIEESQGAIDDKWNPYRKEELFHRRAAKRTENFRDNELKPLLRKIKQAGLTIEDVDRFLWARHAPTANGVLAARNPNQEMIDEAVEELDRAIGAAERELNPDLTDETVEPLERAARAAVRRRLSRLYVDRQRVAATKPFAGKESDRLALSGMTNEEAKAHMDALSPEKRRALNGIADDVDAITQETLDTLVRYGLESRETVDRWRETFPDYVPLMREQDEIDHITGDTAGTGQGMSVRGSATKARTGSRRGVVDVLANIAQARDRAITRGEKNIVAQSLYGLALQSPSKEMWTIVRPGIGDEQLRDELSAMGLDPDTIDEMVSAPRERKIDPKTGAVQSRVSNVWHNAPEVVGLRVNGEQRYVVLNRRNRRSAEIALAMKNLSTPALGAAISSLAMVTRYFAAINTQYNPIFGIVNLTRDVGAAALNLSSTELRGNVAAVLAETAAQMVKALRSGLTRINDPLYEQFELDGGTTGFRDLFTTSQEQNDMLLREVGLSRQYGSTAAERAFGSVSQKLAHNAIANVLSDYNKTLEDMTRFAAYKVAIQQGISRDKAASISKNLTVNFNRKGQMTPTLGAFYAFFNAAVQGNTRTLQTLVRGPAGKRILAGGIGLGVLQAVAMAMAGYREDDLPEFVQENALVIPLGPKDSGAGVVTIPLAYGFNLLPFIGKHAAWYVMSGYKRTGKRAASLLGAILNTFNPLGGGANLLLTATPTVGDIPVALLTNEDWTGREVYREDFSKMDPTPGFTRGKENAPEWAVWLAKQTNTLSGGTEYQPGAMSPTPEHFTYALGQLTGGVGRESMKVWELLTGDEEVASHRLPLAGRFWSDVNDAGGVRSRFYNNVRSLNLHGSEIEGRAEDGENPIEYIRDNPESVLYEDAASEYRALSKLRKEMLGLKKSGRGAAAKLAEKELLTRMRAFNSAVEKLSVE